MIVTVVFARQDVQDVVPVDMAPGATLADAVHSSGLIGQYGLDPTTLKFAVFGTRATGGTRVADGDRVEILGPLFVDPKVVRARRAGARPDGKPLAKPRRPEG